MSTTLKIFLYSLFIGILLIAFYLAYAYGEQTGNKNCVEEKVKVVEKVVEVVKEVTKEEQKILLRPNDNWNTIYKRICAGEKNC